MGSFDLALVKQSLAIVSSVISLIGNMKIIWFFLLTSSIIYWVQCKGYSCPEEDINFFSNEIAQVFVNSWHNCGKVCELANNCLFWSYAEYDGICRLKISDANLWNDTRYISGAKGCT